MSSSSRRRRVASEFRLRRKEEETNRYEVASETMTVEDKLKVLNELGRPDLIKVFNDWKPRVSKSRRRGVPLDQRVTITVTDAERASLESELRAVKASGSAMSMSQFIRNRALGSVDINGWRQIAEAALKDMEETEADAKALKARKASLLAEADEEPDAAEAAALVRRAEEIGARLSRLTSRSTRRRQRLSGRMSMPEAEQVKWRAQRLCISSSDYMRMLVFGLEPDSNADAHMNLDAKRRFYVSVIEVCENGWGAPPTVYSCSQCQNYMDEIRRLRSENDQLRNFM